MNQQHSFIRVTVYFGLFATIAAGLIGLAKQSWSLPLMVGFCSILSIAYTDILGWFTLNKWVVYVAMIAGAGVAILDFLANAPSNQIIEVGNLLVYVQLPLMFQKKSKRVFEQWGVFLLLELVVGALINNNVLYGLLMLPVLMVGCATMMALAHFSSQLRHTESISESTNLWSRLLRWLGKEQLVTNQYSGVRLMAVESPMLSVRQEAISFAPSRWSSSVIPLAFAILLFSLAYFYSLPRLSMNSYDASGGGPMSVGFNEQISLRAVGKLRTNEALIFRMSMRDERKQSSYRPELPPYVRASVSHTYLDGPRMGMWQPGDSGLLRDPRIMRDPLVPSQVSESVSSENDAVTVSIIEKGVLGDVVPAIPPFSQSRSKDGFSLVRRDWRVLDTRESAQLNFQKRRYSYLSYAFKNGVQNPLLPDFEDCLREEEENPPAMQSRFGQYRKEELLEFPDSLRGILPLRDKILSESEAKNGDKLSKALYLEEYFGSGRDYGYTLTLTGPTDRSLDPIVDFLLNKREGHCQFFASALAMLLRSLNIPTRVVVGFRPSEYNDLGEYFLVQQSHAHVWVEAYFTVEELKANAIEVPSYIERGSWMRLDPTPAGDGSNSGGSFRKSSDQTLEMMQELWSDMFLNMDKSKQSTLFSLFGESSNSSYADAWKYLKGTVDRIRNNRIVEVLAIPGRWFSWQVAFSITALGFAVVLMYRLLLWKFPKWVPRIRLRLSQGRSQLSKIDFYNRAVRQLQGFGLHRRIGQTQQEYFHEASEKLLRHGIVLDAGLFSRLFYHRRFGGISKLSQPDQIAVDEALLSLESETASWKKQKNLGRLNQL